MGGYHLNIIHITARRAEWLGSVAKFWRSCDRDGQTLYSILSEKRGTKAAETFFAGASSHNGIQKRITIAKSRSNAAGITEINKIFKQLMIPVTIETVRSKYHRNVVEQNHRFIKRVTLPLLGLKSFASAAATLAEMEVAHMIRKGQLEAKTCGVRQFAQLAGSIRLETIPKRLIVERILA